MSGKDEAPTPEDRAAALWRMRQMSRMQQMSRRRFITLAGSAGAVAAFGGLAAACGSGGGSKGSTPSSSGESPAPLRALSPPAGAIGDVIDLPAPRTDGDLSLEEALATRRSLREFTDEPLTTQQISQLLWATQGITADWGGRTAPSAGALYPLELYVVTRDGLSHYLPEGHRLQILGRTDLRAPLADAALGQTAVSDAPAVFVISAVYERTAEKYEDRAERYVQMEAGHACQNLLLEAVALGLGAVPMGGFSDAEVARTLGLPADQTPLYLVPVGHPAEEPG